MTKRDTTNAQDFSPKLLSVWREPPSPLPRAMLATLLLLLLGIMVWAFFGRLDIVTRAEGTLVPKNRVQIVQPLEGGRVAEILVSEGQRVEAGQALMRMDARISEVETGEMARELTVVRLQLRRVRAELSSEEFTPQIADPEEVYRQIREQLESNQEAYRDAVSEQQAALRRTQAELAGASEVRKKLQDILPIFRNSEDVYTELAENGSIATWEALDRRLLSDN